MSSFSAELMSLFQIDYDSGFCGDDYPVIEIPGSKSVAARRLIIDYIRGEAPEYVNMPRCDDTLELSAALRDLRLGLSGNRYDLGSGGTSMRFFTALVASIEGFDGIVDCSPQLRRRPLSPLVDALRAVGADIEYLEEEGCPPIYIKGGKLKGGEVAVDAGISSQFISALMLVSRLWALPLSLGLRGEIVSRPYVEMTKRLLEMSDDDSAPYIEGDWSAAAFFYAYCLLVPDKDVRIGLLRKPDLSVQGDAAVADIFKYLGVESEWEGDGEVVLRGNRHVIDSRRSMSVPVEFDMGDVPDLVPALAVCMALAGIRFRFIKVSHLRHKESDRLSALQTEMGKIGFAVETGDDFISWDGIRLPMSKEVIIESYEDHRIAMAFSIAAAKLHHITIRGGECVSKSFPGFYGELRKIGFVIRIIY